MTEMQQLLEELNERTYELYARLETNSEFLSEKQYVFMANALHEQYKKSYEMLNLEHGIEYRTRMYQFKQIVNLQVPWQFLIFKNKMARVITAEIKEDFIAQFKVRYAQLESEKEKADRKQAAQDKKDVKTAQKQAKKEAKATRRRLKKDAKKRRNKPKKKDQQGK